MFIEDQKLIFYLDMSSDSTMNKAIVWERLGNMSMSQGANGEFRLTLILSPVQCQQLKNAYYT